MAVLVLGAASAAASAEGLEETYAKLCGNGQKNETCDTLRKGLLEKLTRESGGGAGAAVPMAAQAQQILPGQQTTGPIAAAALSPNRELMTTLSSDQRPLDPRWGVLARLVGTQWASDDVGDKNPKLPRVYRHFVSFSWLDGGEAIEIQDGIELTKAAPAIIVVLRPASQPGTFDGEIRQPKVAKRWQTKFRTDETGAVVSDWYKVIDAGHGLREMHARRGYRLMPDGSLAQVGANGWEKDRPAMRDPNDPELVKHRLRPYAASDLSALIKEQIASYPDLIEMEKQTETMQARLAQMQQERAARKASSGGLLGALIGAAVGAYAGTAAGLDTAQVAGAMMKGMSVTAPQSPLAGALAGTGTQLLTGGSTSSVVAGLGSATSGASYPTRPNLATGACSGFSEANYRTKALEGGGDSQLNTMCGQAFEYYTMYKRAIAQGYSEADANRTYAAHEQAARVASGYLSSHGAN